MADEQIKRGHLEQDGYVLFNRTLASLVKNNAGQDLGDVEAGAQVNKLETIKVNGTAQTITDKAVNIPVPTKASDIGAAAASHDHTSADITDLSTTIGNAIKDKADKATTLAGYGIADAYTKDQTDSAISAALTSAFKPAGSAASVSALGALDAAHEGFVYNMSAAFTTTADFVEGAGQKHKAGTNVGIVNVGTAESPSYKYDCFSGFVDTSAYDTHIADSDIHVTAADKTAWNGKQDAISDLATIRSNASAGAAAKTAVDAMGDIVSHDASEFAVAGHNHDSVYQAKITSSAKLDADLVADANSTNKFVTASQISAWNNKQNALTFDSTPTENSTNPVTSGGVYAALLTGIQFVEEV